MLYPLPSYSSRCYMAETLQIRRKTLYNISTHATHGLFMMEWCLMRPRMKSGGSNFLIRWWRKIMPIAKLPDDRDESMLHVLSRRYRYDCNFAILQQTLSISLSPTNIIWIITVLKLKRCSPNLFSFIYISSITKKIKSIL